MIFSGILNYRAIDHIENFDIEAEGKEEAKEEIEDELEDAQIMKGTNTYHALEHVSQMSFRSIHRSLQCCFKKNETSDDITMTYLRNISEITNELCKAAK